MGHLLNILKGMGAGSRALQRRSYHYPVNGFAQDRMALNGDMRGVIYRLGKNAEKAYGKQTNAG